MNIVWSAASGLLIQSELQTFNQDAINSDLITSNAFI